MTPWMDKLYQGAPLLLLNLVGASGEWVKCEEVSNWSHDLLVDRYQLKPSLVKCDYARTTKMLLVVLGLCFNNF